MKSVCSFVSLVQTNLGTKSVCSLVTKCKDSVVESGVCGCVSEFDIAGIGAVYIKAYGGTLCVFLPDARAHDQSRRQKTALLQAEIRKAVKRSVAAGSSFDRFFCSRDLRLYRSPNSEAEPRPPLGH